MRFTTQSLDTFWNEYAPLAVGLDEMFNRLDTMQNSVNVNYPPYNIVKHDNSNYTVEVALAGFKPEEIEVFFVENDISPTGLGEPGLPPAVGALANAIYQATGQRLYKQPFAYNMEFEKVIG